MGDKTISCVWAVNLTWMVAALLFKMFGISTLIFAFQMHSVLSFTTIKMATKLHPRLHTVEQPTASEGISEAASLTNQKIVGTAKDLLSIVYGERHFARFAALETIARVPYFSYTSVLHLYETLGWFRQKEHLKLHFAESWNEMHHLLIMESLGGSDKFFDRFVSQHIAVFYYWFVVIAFLFNPAWAYNFNHHVEKHAFETYDEFLKTHGEELKREAAPQVAVDYYTHGEKTLFDAFHSYSLNQDRKPMSELVNERRPLIENLYDVFFNIRADEEEHAKTMSILEADAISRNHRPGENT